MQTLCIRRKDVGLWLATFIGVWLRVWRIRSELGRAFRVSWLRGWGFSTWALGFWGSAVPGFCVEAVGPKRLEGCWEQ